MDYETKEAYDWLKSDTHLFNNLIELGKSLPPSYMEDWIRDEFEDSVFYNQYNIDYAELASMFIPGQE